MHEHAMTLKVALSDQSPSAALAEWLLLAFCSLALGSLLVVSHLSLLSHVSCMNRRCQAVSFSFSMSKSHSQSDEAAQLAIQNHVPLVATRHTAQRM